MIISVIENDTRSTGQLIRLTWQCSSTYRSTDHFGGCNGARIRFSPQKDWVVKVNTDQALEKLSSIQDYYGGNLSWSDLIVFSGFVAIQQRGGNEMRFCPGRSDALDGDGGPDFSEPKIENTVELLPTNEFLDAISISGLTTREFTALYGGDYVLGETQNCGGIFCLRDSFMRNEERDDQPIKDLSNQFLRYFFLNTGCQWRQ